jgi:hypothetical protein
MLYSFAGEEPVGEEWANKTLSQLNKDGIDDEWKWKTVKDMLAIEDPLFTFVLLSDNMFEFERDLKGILRLVTIFTTIFCAFSNLFSKFKRV